MNKSKWIAVVFMGLSVAACGGDEPGTNPPGTTPDDMQADVVDETPDAPDTRPDMTDAQPDMCTPRTSCEDACGRLDDGCGGTLECGACDCVNGTPTVPTCGQCGLGTASCDAQGVRSCTEPPSIPGLDGLDAEACTSALLYVAVGSGREDGTREAPFKSIEAALAAAAQTSKVKAILIGGANEYASASGIMVREGVSLIGGWDASWAVSADSRPIIKSSATFDNGDVFGVAARDIVRPTLLHNLIIQTTDAQQPGASNYALHAVNAGGLLLKHLRITAGAGGNGIDGEAGLTGMNGNPGDDAPVIACLDNPNIRYWGGSNQACTPQAQCEGGMSGIGKNAFFGALSGLNAPSGALGGAGGASLGSPSGRDGAPGVALGPGGAPGAGGLSQGQVNDGLWTNQGHGGDGTRGANGGGGGGGGGALKGLTINATTDCAANGGGSGGAGGQGGAGGKGGTGGGASFGLFLVESNLTLEQVTALAGFGGVGGKGGTAGAGGLGARGGRGGTQVRRDGVVYASPSRGGDGGAGAAGLLGGHGGGGAGGASYGGYCHNSDITVITNTASFLAGGSAFGGTSLGIAGADGVSIDQHRCL